MNNNFFNLISNKFVFNEELLNNSTYKIRLYYPNTAELNSNTLKFIDNTLLKDKTIIRKSKGITVLGRILKENLKHLHDSFCTFQIKDEDGIYRIQRFIPYFPNHHYLHFYTFTKNITKAITKEDVQTNMGVEAVEVDECNVKIMNDVHRYSAIILFNKSTNTNIINNQIQSYKNNNNQIKVYFCESISREDREEAKKKNKKQTTTNQAINNTNIIQAIITTTKISTTTTKQSSQIN
ncbi:hypothetical protein DDB_G0270888 [Dictyostelium discoideum AX4]|uniref:Uncharacterized protein n=1 Tax=Dictyostelium discoideum TaxID=44689 RepID=Q55DS7_DICDI|nr:hypothetical protein DDB_G0270888 [Dictyostelium discoideum AX4]EAL72794.1 hypothetical protein DDB_G0270888 [Dictyostelium discoideum AX4]|eukprot:XP_646054.1 hypothetical protein DDB_G0270888 [Dictyostelium discoideum AX4]